MKKIILLAIMSVSLSSFAQTVVKEYDPAVEDQCFKELSALKCVTAQGEEDLRCAESNKSQLSKTCKALHDEKKL